MLASHDLVHESVPSSWHSPSAMDMQFDWRQMSMDSFSAAFPTSSLLDPYEAPSLTDSMSTTAQAYSDATQSMASPLSPLYDESAIVTLSQHSKTRTVPAIMAPLEFTPAAIDAYLSMPDVQHNNVSIPASYIRAQHAKLKKSHLARTEATHHVLFFVPRVDPVGKSHFVHVNDYGRDNQQVNERDTQQVYGREADEEEEETLFYPVHEWVMASQCTAWHSTAIASFFGPTPVKKMPICHIDSMNALFTFLHTHDEKELYAELQDRWDAGSLDGEAWMRGFIANVRACGIYNDLLRGVIWSVVDA